MKNIWRFLSDEAKERVLDDVLDANNKDQIHEIRADLARKLRFRPVFIKRKSKDEILKLFRSHFPSFGEDGLDYLVSLHLDKRWDLLCAFYDGMG
ncbi:MAG: hypothetical protein QGH30_08525, partial [Candidatus Krumholzibacteria bacterium]|nr:hypothetical protein [Candidatus Krumholzibacteria bacterium]